MENKYKIKVKLKTEAIFTNGESDGNVVSSKVLADEYGFAYYHAKTFRGQLKKQAYVLYDCYKKMNCDDKRAENFLNSLVILFGMSKQENVSRLDNFKKCNLEGILKLSNLELDKEIRDFFIEVQREDEEKGYYRINPYDIIEAQTNIRTKIKVDEGVAQEKRLKSYHTVKDGLIFYSDLFFDSDPAKYIDDLYRITKSVRYIGAGVHRGRGRVEIDLLKNNEIYKLGGAK